MKRESGFSSKKISRSKHKKDEKFIEDNKNENYDIFDSQEIKKDLKIFYDKEAKKYTETRKKFWHEEKIILESISSLFTEGKQLRVLEFGCGSGRFATLLNQNFSGRFDYVGVDLSGKLLSYASKDNPNLTFFQGDITKLIKNFEQESFDLIVGTSSFQHIPTNMERSFLMKNFYRLLNYDGTLLMTNWSLSKRFTKRHKNLVFKAKILSWIKLNSGSARDLMVPRTDNEGNIYERFYHFFSLKELEDLANFSGLTLKINTFIDGNGNFTNDEKISRSSFFVATKTPIIQ